MGKNMKLRIILLLFLTNIIVISILGIFFLNSINSLELQNENTAIATILTTIRSHTSILLIGLGLVVALISIITAVVLSKFVIYPINKLIKSTEKINEEERKSKKNYSGKKKKEFNNFENAIDAMTAELQEKLSEVSTQKNQIETILLHLTDGIIAFNMQGEIILINPAAKKLLSIRPEDNTFDDIFKKFNLDINMEKIIYLENWTSTEQRIQVDEIYVNVFFAPFKNEDDRPDGVIAVIQDITEHVKLDNMQKEFVADVSHELKTPITSIMGYADTLLEGGYDNETQVKFLNVIATEARRMARLVTDLLTLSRYDSNKKKTRKEYFDLG